MELAVIWIDIVKWWRLSSTLQASKISLQKYSALQEAKVSMFITTISSRITIDSDWINNNNNWLVPA